VGRVFLFARTSKCIGWGVAYLELVGFLSAFLLAQIAFLFI